MSGQRAVDPMDLAESAKKLAAHVAPGAGCFVSVQKSRFANVRFAQNEATSNGDDDEYSIGVRIVHGKRHAVATTNQSSIRDLRKTIERASEMAKLSPEDPEAMPLVEQVNVPPVPLAADPATAALEANARAGAIRSIVNHAEKEGLVAAGYYAHKSLDRVLVNSVGLRQRHASTEAKLTSTIRTADGRGSGWAGDESTRAHEIHAEAIARVAAEKGKQSVDARPLDPGRYTVILEPAAIGDLIGFLLGELDARRADEGRSFFSKRGGGNRIGESLFAKSVTLRSDPADPLLPSSPFDDEGLALRATNWIENGELRNLHYSRYWAKKSGKEPNGNAHGFHLSGGEAASLAELIAGVDRGLLITRFWYVRWLESSSMLVTGLTRDGVFLIERGKVQHAVNNFRFNESPVAVLRNVEAMTRMTYRIPSYGTLMRVPAIRAKDFLLASQSRAV